MSVASLNSVFTDALTLADEDRLQLVESLIPTIKSDPLFEAERIQEAKRRMEEVCSGKVTTVPGEQVFREIEESLAARRPA